MKISQKWKARRRRRKIRDYARNPPPSKVEIWGEGGGFSSCYVVIDENLKTTKFLQVRRNFQLRAICILMQ